MNGVSGTFCCLGSCAGMAELRIVEHPHLVGCEGMITVALGYFGETFGRRRLSVIGDDDCRLPLNMLVGLTCLRTLVYEASPRVSWNS